MSLWLWEMTLGRTAGSPLPGLHEARPQGPVRLRGTQRARLPSEVGSLSHQGSEKPLEVDTVPISVNKWDLNLRDGK